MIETELEGDDKTARLLQSLQTPGFLMQTFERIGAQLNTDLATYPAERPESNYVRTNTLGRNWTHEEFVSLYEISTVLGNVTPYAPYVQDPDEQAGMHVGTWQTTADVMKKREQWIIEQIETGIQLHIATFQ